MISTETDRNNNQDKA